MLLRCHSERPVAGRQTILHCWLQHVHRHKSIQGRCRYNDILFENIDRTVQKSKLTIAQNYTEHSILSFILSNKNRMGISGNANLVTSAEIA